MASQGVARQNPLALIVGIAISATLLIGVVISVIEISRIHYAVAVACRIAIDPRELAG